MILARAARNPGGLGKTGPTASHPHTRLTTAWAKHRRKTTVNRDEGESHRTTTRRDRADLRGVTAFTPARGVVRTPASLTDRELPAETVDKHHDVLGLE